tara:strand:+ start:517 stop:1296 length:780 start_codon:yes stop_codon:yes gene_type:complete
MSNTIVVIKTYPDMVNQHKSLPVDYFEIPIRPIIFGKPVSLEEQIEAFLPIKHKVIGIHGSIYREGVNLCDSGSFAINKQAFDYVEQASTVFDSIHYQLFHAGHMIANKDCSFKHIFNFIQQHKLEKLMIEFEPFFSYKERLVFPLHTVEEWVEFHKIIKTDIVLDTAHCFITANALRYNFYDYFSQLTEALNPSVIHLSTTDLTDGGFNDKHLPFSQGAIDFKRIDHCFRGRILVIEVNNVSLADIEFTQQLIETIKA